MQIAYLLSINKAMGRIVFALISRIKLIFLLQITCKCLIISISSKTNIQVIHDLCITTYSNTRNRFCGHATKL